MSPFMGSLGYQLTLFEYQEEKAVIPSFRANLHRCRSVWRHVRATLLCSSLQVQKRVNQCRALARTYLPGHRVCLSSKDLPLQVESRKLAPLFVGPFKVDRMVNAATVQLKLGASMSIHGRDTTRRVVCFPPTHPRPGTPLEILLRPSRKVQ